MMNALNLALAGTVVALALALIVVLDHNRNLSDEMAMKGAVQAAELIDTFKEKYSDREITEFPDSQGIPYKYVAHIGYSEVELLLEKDRVVLKAWKDDEDALCIVSNPTPRDIMDNCPLKW